MTRISEYIDDSSPVYSPHQAATACSLLVVDTNGRKAYKEDVIAGQ